LIDPARCCLFVGPQLKKFKLDLFLRIGRKIEAMGGSMIHGDFEAVKRLPDEVIPIIGCSPELRQSIEGWQARGRQFIYWDRGYARRVFATWLPRGENGGYYRWHLNAYQMKTIRDVPGDRWAALQTPLSPWARNPKGHIEVAAGSPTYDRFHCLGGSWARDTVAKLKQFTDREIRVSDKESKVPLSERIKGAHALVTHGSNAATEAVIMGCPVFVSDDSAAALVGLTDLSKIETPIYPEREPWVRSLAYCQYNEDELVDGTLWRLIE
jgi:hypothetical protein